MKYLIVLCAMGLGLSSCTSSEENIIEKANPAETGVLNEEIVTEENIQTDEILSEVIENPKEEIIQEAIVYNEFSIPTLRDKDITGTDLVLEEVLTRTNIYTRYRISYTSGDLSLSGIMNIPIGEGPFPLLVLAHGYIDTSVYTNGRGLKREQDYFANNGYAVIHPDYRNHAFSDKVPTEPYDFRLGYTEDVIASIYAVQNSSLSELAFIDSEKVGLLGHSMGGGISQNISVVRPDLIDAVVLYGPVSNDEYTNFEKFQISNARRSTRVTQVLSEHQNPEENSFFWENVSSRAFFKDIEVPFQIYSGTNDTDTPTQWAQDIAADLEETNNEADLIIYEGEKHEFINRWPDFMESSKVFFDENIRK